MNGHRRAESAPASRPERRDACGSPRQYISRRTVQTYQVYVFAKLDIAARAQLAAQVTATASRSRPRTGRTGRGQRSAR